jgi:hypothetical protein
VVEVHACSAPSDLVCCSTAPDQPDPFGWLDQFVDELMPAVIRYREMLCGVVFQPLVNEIWNWALRIVLPA